VSTAAGYSGTPLTKKLGLRAGDALLLVGAPMGWSVPELPADIAVSSDPHGAGADGAVDVAISFCSQLAELNASVPALAPRICPDGAIGAAWPRRAAGHDSDIRDQDIRDIALPLGLVDVKVAALDQDWSGLRLVWRREKR
jgi:hypothetical protein